MMEEEEYSVQSTWFWSIAPSARAGDIGHKAEVGIRVLDKRCIERCVNTYCLRTVALNSDFLQNTA